MGNVYKFKLQKLLEMREEKEEEGKRLFKESSKALRDEEEKLEKINRDISKYRGINKGEDIVYQKVKRNYLKALEISKNVSEKEVVKKKNDVEVKRKYFIEKQLERKTVEKLKENEKDKFYKELDRVEQINNDEFALYGYMRKIGGDFL